MNEITLTEYQATIFSIVEGYFSSKGYLGEDLFEDTYVLQKKLAEYIYNNVSLSRGSESDSVVANRAYTTILNISKIQPTNDEVVVLEETNRTDGSFSNQNNTSNSEARTNL